MEIGAYLRLASWDNEEMAERLPAASFSVDLLVKKPCTQLASKVDLVKWRQPNAISRARRRPRIQNRFSGRPALQRTKIRIVLVRPSSNCQANNQKSFPIPDSRSLPLAS